MHEHKVSDVMTNEVLTVPATATPADVVRALTAHDVSALAVVDDYDVVIGVVTRSDVLGALDLREEQPRGWWRRPRPEVGWRHTSARQMMSAPPVTVAPDATLARAGRLMHEAGVKRLLVTDHRRHLVGIVAAADLLSVFARREGTVPLVREPSADRVPELAATR